VLALDRTSLADATLAQIASLPETVRSGYTFQKADLADYEAFEQLVKNAEPAVLEGEHGVTSLEEVEEGV
jgi:hypothetical protein